MRIRYLLVIVAVVVLLSGCASGYKRIYFEALQYENRSEAHDFPIEMVSNILGSRENAKYKKRAGELGYEFFALKIHNNTLNDIILTEDNFFAYADSTRVKILDMSTNIRYMKQISGAYWAWGLFMPILTITEEGSDGDVD